MSSFNKECGVPYILLMDDCHYQSQWVAQEIPRKKGQRKNISFWRVFNKRTGMEAWNGSDKAFAQRLANRLGGWEDSVYFPPPGRHDAEGK